MAKTIITVLTALLFIPLFSFSQSKLKVSVGVKFAPGFAFTKTNPSELLVGGQVPTFGFRSLVDVRLRTKFGLFFETGLETTKMGYQTKWRTLITSEDIDPITGETISNSGQLRNRNTVYTFGIPIGIGFQFRPGKWGISLAVGSTFNIPMNLNKSTFEIESNSDDPALESRTTKRSYWQSGVYTTSPYVSLDFIRTLIAGLDITAGLSAQTNVTLGIPNAVSWKQFLYLTNAGVSVGLRYNFGSK